MSVSDCKPLNREKLQLKSSIRLHFRCRVFELNPQIKKMMPEFNTNDPVEELKSARALFGHSKTYMKCLENAVTSMDDNERFVTYLVELGRRHQVRPLKAHYLDVSRLSLLTGFPFSQFIRPGRLCSDDSDFFDKSVTMCQFFEKRGWWPA